jgi:hypothetical protein
MVLLVLVINFRDDSLPDETGLLKLPGLLDEAIIERDDFGVIHIRAKNEHDMFFSQGVACAQERLWQMELQRRVGAGTLSAIVGEDALDVDKEVSIPPSFLFPLSLSLFLLSLSFSSEMVSPPSHFRVYFLFLTVSYTWYLSCCTTGRSLPSRKLPK